jgi:hypothetical protein
MEGWRQRRLGSREQSGKGRNAEERRKREKNERNGLTLTGLLMEGVRKCFEMCALIRSTFKGYR